MPAPLTLSELRTDFLNRVREATGVTATNTIVDRYLNLGLVDMHLHKQWWWAERRDVIVTRDDYSTGTVTVSEGATAVTGASTVWTTANAFGVNNARADDKITLGAVSDVYRISAVGSATSLTLASRFTGSDLSAGSYTVFQDEYSLASDFWQPLDYRIFSEERGIRLLSPRDFYRLYPRNSIRGAPKFATLIELGPSGSTTLRRRVVFAPAPDNEYTIPYRYITTSLGITSAGAQQAQLTNDTDEPIVPLRYRQGVVYHALYHWYRDRKDDVRSQEAKAEYEGLMLRAAQDIVPSVEDRLRFVLDIPAPGSRRSVNRRRQFSIDSAWDQLRW